MTVKEQLIQLEKRFDRKLVSLKRELQKEITPLKDFMAGQQDVKKLEKGQDISISPAAWNIIKWLLLFIGALVTGRVLL